MAKSLKYSSILIVLGIVAGFLLAFVNNITSGIIEERQQEELRAALEEYFPYEAYSPDQSVNYDNLNSKISAIYFGFGADNKLAAVIYKTVGTGWGGDVVSLIAIDAQGNFIDAKMVEATKETPGKGDKYFTFDFNIASESVSSYSAAFIAGTSDTAKAVIGGIDAAASHFKTIASTVGGITND
jgi:Na+-translocating ferredoxin:NAD+ oxidoreductase RnfG subunit